MARIEELGWQETPMGEIVLRRRTDPETKQVIYEVKLGDEYLMSSLFTVAERQLAVLGLAAAEGDDLRVLIGGLGLGYTTVAALRDDRIGAIEVVDAVPAVVDWHNSELLPTSVTIARDGRVAIFCEDFFEFVGIEAEPGFVLYDVILLDVDHSPRHTLHPSHAAFYTVPRLATMATHLSENGVFALWSDDPPDAVFLTTLASVFEESRAHDVVFPNRLTGGTSANTVYVGVRPSRRAAQADDRHVSFGDMSFDDATSDDVTFDDVVRVLDETAVVAVITTKADGEAVATPIWSMVIDGVPYVRSVNGAGAAWYRHVRSGRPVAFALGDGSIAESDRVAALELPRAEVTTSPVPVDDEVQARIDEEMWRKYAGQTSSVNAMLQDHARECTLRIDGLS